jgi:tRNA (guanine37-N1)-methyltransferase
VTYDILTLFPGMFDGPLTESILKRAAESGLIEVRCHNIRDYATDKHRSADDAPYGGGTGMIMKVEPLAGCIEAVKGERPGAKVILMTPRGRTFTQQMARELAGETGLIIICGRYEGVDERVSTLYVDQEISLGDFVLTGGELAAMVIVDAVSRFIPGVLGGAGAAQTDSFSDGLLEYPQYTRPPEFRGMKVPEQLLSGNHAEIARWRRGESLLKSRQIRPDLLASAEMTEKERRWLAKNGTDGGMS